MKVWTDKGLIERAELTVSDIVIEDENARAIATEWYLKDERVRRDVWINVLRPQTIGVETA